jgi:hypothetical protein
MRSTSWNKRERFDNFDAVTCVRLCSADQDLHTVNIIHCFSKNERVSIPGLHCLVKHFSTKRALSGYKREGRELCLIPSNNTHLTPLSKSIAH